ncbi:MULTISPECIES: flagellar basal body-associated FliL family protein [unclassified Brevundimonas]|uniref:flagellar basal body-associated FliL family protein n=1 Tax=unclassified Brevundimonas TaxID=2622653 RepID=UPI000E8A6A20|nr:MULTISPECIES: flagellar basal body-associated FliL family protein [unclassified Brevundimonas]MCK6104411.1 flagellar basal body-associated FliL family protein [Brevundimonas sp. EYE_349]HBI18574.1 flagellar basal body protein FliL [Brevundimonas sp.]
MFKFGKKKGDPAADANLPAVKEGEAAVEGEDAAAPKKKKLPLLFIIAPVALLVLGGGGAAAFFMLKPKPAEAHGAAAEAEHGAEKADKKEDKKGGGHGGGGKEGEADPSLGVISDGPDGVTFYTLPDMVMNIQSADGRPTFLKLKLTLEMQDAGVASHLQEEMPRLQDMFTGFVRELRPEDLSGSAGTYQLRAEILRRVNLIAAPGKVDAVLIEEMLVQ